MTNSLTGKNSEELQPRKTAKKGGAAVLGSKPQGTSFWLSSLFFAVCSSSLFFPVKAFAQSLEARIDGIAANPAAVHAGAGIVWPVGTYLRSGIEAGIGASKSGLSGRADFVNRFHLDPFREHRWAPYGGGGITARFDKDRKTRFYLLLVAGVDGPARGGLSTSIEAGLGGGARLGMVVRKTKAERR